MQPNEFDPVKNKGFENPKARKRWPKHYANDGCVYGELVDSYRYYHAIKGRELNSTCTIKLKTGRVVGLFYHTIR